jgi:FkbM family methyltransferase
MNEWFVEDFYEFVGSSLSKKVSILAPVFIMLKRFFFAFTGYRFLQGFYEKLYTLALRGMNYGNGGNYRESGEKWVIEYVRRTFRNEKLVVFDVGANVGNYGLALRSILGQGASIYAFEPSAATYAKLQAALGNDQSVVLNKVGLSNQAGTLTLYSNAEGSDFASVYERNLDHHGVQMNQKEEIQLKTLDDYCAEMQIERIHFLKLDIEGNELNALKGASNLLEKGAIAMIQFEFGGCNVDARTFFRDYWLLLHDQFRIYRILKDGLAEVKQYNENFEIFANINYLAIKR